MSRHWQPIASGVVLVSAVLTARIAVGFQLARIGESGPRVATASDRSRGEQGPDRQDAATGPTVTADEIVRSGRAAEDKEDPTCVDLYASAALRCWDTWTAPSSHEQQQRAWKNYHESVERLVVTGWKYQRLDPLRGIEVRLANGEIGAIPIARFGFSWSDRDFDEFMPASTADPKQLPRYWRQNGLGVPLIIVRRRPEPRGFLGAVVPFAATAMLRPAVAPQDEPLNGFPRVTTIGVLELHDPLHVSHVACGSVNYSLSRDISAPFALVKKDVNRENWRDFARPGREDMGHGLRMVQAYQPGKIPVILVHGLLSDKFTWIPLANDLRTVTWINERYQLWTFQYPTGQAFLRSGAELRKAIRDAAATLDPQSTDPAMRQIVLIGHSMGGLVSKLQITSSGTILWDKFARRQLSEIQASSQEFNELETLFFFEPSRSVRCVVFMGTPHRGSTWAENIVGRLGASLVKHPQDRLDMLSSLLKNNPNVFDKELSKGLPASIEFLKQDNPLLVGLQQLPISPEVTLHSIVGTGKDLSDGSPGDGVVAVTSARHPAVASEKFVVAKHSELLQHPDAIQEIINILGEHLRRIDAAPDQTAPQMPRRLVEAARPARY